MPHIKGGGCLEMKKFLLPFTNRHAFGDNESDMSKLGVGVAIAIILALSSVTIYTICRNGQKTIVNSNATQIQQENTSITRK